MDRCKTPDGHCSRCLWLVESTNEEKQAYLHICIQFSFVMIYFCKRKTCVVRMRRTAKNHTRLQPFYREYMRNIHRRGNTFFVTYSFLYTHGLRRFRIHVQEAAYSSIWANLRHFVVALKTNPVLMVLYLFVSFK